MEFIVNPNVNPGIFLEVLLLQSVIFTVCLSHLLGPVQLGEDFDVTTVSFCL